MEAYPYSSLLSLPLRLHLHLVGLEMVMARTRSSKFSRTALVALVGCLFVRLRCVCPVGPLPLALVSDHLMAPLAS